ncbi:MAG: DNA repair protein RecN, partial [Cyanobacteria bacterium P01_H01_bin.121]
KACFSQVDPVDTMIFDEIDVGVSGRVSQAIAEKLHQLSQGHQVICVTHQPLIAAMADQHFRVRKETPGKNRTIIDVQTLIEQEARREELAELAGGEFAQESLNFAESLLKQAAERRQTQQEREAVSLTAKTKSTQKVSSKVSPQNADGVKKQPTATSKRRRRSS